MTGWWGGKSLKSKKRKGEQKNEHYHITSNPIEQLTGVKPAPWRVVCGEKVHPWWKIGNRSGKGKTTSLMVCPCKRGCRGSIHNGKLNNKHTHQCNPTTRSRLLVRAKVQEGEGLRASEGLQRASEGASTMESRRVGATNTPTKVTRRPGQGYSWGAMCRGWSWWMFKILRGWRTCAMTCLDKPLSVSHRVVNWVKCAYLEWGQSARMVIPANPLQDIGT